MTIKHGFYRGKKKSPEYYVFSTMKQRCLNPKNKKFKDYGGRGIKLCSRWLKFENFLDDMGLRPSPTHSIGRIDNNGDYCPENCEWQTRRQQSLNKRNNRVLELNGRRQTVLEWAEELKVRPDFIHTRLTAGWTPERALTEPAHDRGQNNK